MLIIFFYVHSLPQVLQLGFQTTLYASNVADSFFLAPATPALLVSLQARENAWAVYMCVLMLSLH